MPDRPSIRMTGQRSRVAEALAPAFTVAAGFVALSLAGYIWRPDAGVSAPSLLATGLGVFAFAFAVTYASRSLLDRGRTAEPGVQARAYTGEVVSFDASLVGRATAAGQDDAPIPYPATPVAVPRAAADRAER